METQLLEQQFKSMLESNEKEHRQILDALKEVRTTLANLKDDFPTREEYLSAENRITNIEGILKGVGMTIFLAVMGGILKLVLL
jgi:multidrug efflux pump subunit AcrB